MQLVSAIKKKKKEKKYSIIEFVHLFFLFETTDPIASSRPD